MNTDYSAIIDTYKHDLKVLKTQIEKREKQIESGYTKALNNMARADFFKDLETLKEMYRDVESSLIALEKYQKGVKENVKHYYPHRKTYKNARE